MPTNNKGDRRERELVNLLDDSGFAVMRAPASGSATDRDLPDVLAGDGEWFYAFEAKSSNGDPIYIDAEEIESLKFFAENFGAIPLLAVRFDGDTQWYFRHPDETYRTDGGNYRLKHEVVREHGLTLTNL